MILNARGRAVLDDTHAAMLDGEKGEDTHHAMLDGSDGRTAFLAGSGGPGPMLTGGDNYAAGLEGEEGGDTRAANLAGSVVDTHHAILDGDGVQPSLESVTGMRLPDETPRLTFGFARTVNEAATASVSVESPPAAAVYGCVHVDEEYQTSVTRDDGEVITLLDTSPATFFDAAPHAGTNTYTAQGGLNVVKLVVIPVNITADTHAAMLMGDGGVDTHAAILRGESFGNLMAFLTGDEPADMHRAELIGSAGDAAVAPAASAITMPGTVNTSNNQENLTIFISNIWSTASQVDVVVGSNDFAYLVSLQRAAKSILQFTNYNVQMRVVRVEPYEVLSTYTQVTDDGVFVEMGTTVADLAQDGTPAGTVITYRLEVNPPVGFVRWNPVGKNTATARLVLSDDTHAAMLGGALTDTHAAEIIGGVVQDTHVAVRTGDDTHAVEFDPSLDTHNAVLQGEDTLKAVLGGTEGVDTHEAVLQGAVHALHRGSGNGDVRITGVDE